MAKNLSRRAFVKGTTLAGVGVWASTAPKESKAANEKINFGCIGVGGKGSSDSSAAGGSGNVVAICDTSEGQLNRAAGRFKGAKKYFDYRKMLEDKSIDAVTVSTPDHNHATAASLAMRAGKHCFCQKPLTRAIFEARRLGELAKEMKVATQMGNQGTAGSGLRHSAALLKANALGKVTDVYVWSNRPVWPQGIARPKGTPPVPSGLHWEEWLGPAKARPYHSAYQPFKWRGWWDFGSGALGDMACHTVNMAYMGLDLKNPTSVQAETSGHNGETYPSWSIIKFAFPANDWRGAINFTWSDGGKRPGKEVTEGHRVGRSGCVIVGEKGKLYSGNDYGSDRQIWSKDKLEMPEVKYEKSPGHFKEWVRAIKGGPKAVSNFTDYAGPLTETILLGNLAVWSAAKKGEPGKKVEWDAKNLKPTNAPELMSIVKPEYRKGYSI